MSKFSIGDRVQLTEGDNPLAMTVTKVVATPDGYVCTCAWFDKENDRQEADFPESVLAISMH